MKRFASNTRDCHPVTESLFTRAAISADIPIPVFRFLVAFVDQVVRDLDVGDPHSRRSALAWVYSRDHHFLSIDSVAELLGLEPHSMVRILSRIDAMSDAVQAA